MTRRLACAYMVVQFNRRNNGWVGYRLPYTPCPLWSVRGDWRWYSSRAMSSGRLAESDSCAPLRPRGYQQLGPPAQHCVTRWRSGTLPCCPLHCWTLSLVRRHCGSFLRSSNGTPYEKEETLTVVVMHKMWLICLVQSDVRSLRHIRG